MKETSAGQLNQALKEVEDAFRDKAAEYAPTPESEEIGRITAVGRGVVRAKGLSRVQSEELVTMGQGHYGMVLDLLPDRLGIILLSQGTDIMAGDEAARTGRILDVPVGQGLIGRVVDPLGRPLDGKGEIEEEARLPVMREAPPIIHRAPVAAPLQTGIKVVDTLIPIGRGQRELILGDRQTGKTAIAVDAILNQKDGDMVCVYCAIGQRSSTTAKVLDSLTRSGAMKYTLLVVVAGDAPAGLQYIAPYAAVSMAEHFMAKGKDVLVVFDDLTRHASAYRELSLLLRRPPGREAFPGDIFYVHSRLLERSTRLKPEHGGGSLTALPIAETEAQNISAYIPTNLISITDGQIYLSPDLFQKGILPAVDVGRSVSRVGGKAQHRGYSKITGELRLSYSQFQELETFSRFGTRLDEETLKTLEHGRRVREILKQDQSSPLTAGEQIAVLSAVVNGMMDKIPLERVPLAEKTIVEICRGQADFEEKLRQGDFSGELMKNLETVLAREAGRDQPEAK